MSVVTRKHVFGVCDQGRLKQACSATETSQSLEISAVANYRYYTIQAANNKGADQTARMHRLICSFVVRIWQKKTGFLMTWLKDKRIIIELYKLIILIQVCQKSPEIGPQIIDEILKRM